MWVLTPWRPQQLSFLPLNPPLGQRIPNWILTKSLPRLVAPRLLLCDTSSHAQRLWKLARLAKSAVPAWQSPPLASPLSLPPGHFICPLMMLTQGWLDHFLTNTDILSDVHPKHQQCGVGQDAPKVYLCPWGCPASAYSWGVFPQGHDTALTHAQSHYPKLGVWCPWVGQDGCKKWTCFASSKSYAMHLATFHGVYTSWDPVFPTTEWPLPYLDADHSTIINHFFIHFFIHYFTSNQ